MTDRKNSKGRHYADATKPRGNQHAMDAKNGQAQSKTAPNNKKKKNIVPIILIVLGVVLLLSAAILGIGKYLDDKAAQDEYDQYMEYVDFDNVQEDPDLGGTVPKVDWESLKAVNEDIIGWIYIPGTKVNYPVLQGTDNDEYLRTTPEGERRVAGSIFMDSESSPLAEGTNTIIYGHNMRNGSMFHDVVKFSNDQTYFDNHDVVYYLTPLKNFVLTPLFAYKTTGSDKSVRQFVFDEPDGLSEYISSKHNKATTSKDKISLSEIEKIYQLSTCSYEQSDGRTILLCSINKEADTRTDEESDPINKGAQAAPQDKTTEQDQS